MLGILAGTAQGYQAAMFYMISYVIVAGGAFGMILLLARQGFESDKLVDFKGLNARSPWFAGMMAILMFSLAGVPPFIGFWAKLGVIQAVLNVSYTWLAVVAVLFSVVGAFYYLRIVKLMYFDEPTDDAVIGGSTLMRTVLSLECASRVLLGRRTRASSRSASALFMIGKVKGLELGPARAGQREAPDTEGALVPPAALALARLTRVQWAALRCGVEQSGSSSGS